MADIKFSNEEKQLLTEKTRTYFETELNRELGQFEADFLLDFIAEEMGAYFYNRGLYDAQAIMQSKMDAIIESIYEIEKPV